jgi:hypothetical protein
VNFEIVFVVKVLVEDLEVVVFPADSVDLLACDDVDFELAVFELLVVDCFVVEVDDFDSEVYVETMELRVALLAEEMAEVGGGHSCGGLESYRVRMLFTAE